MPNAARRIFWSRTKRLTALLLAAWLLVNLLVPWFARSLDSAHSFGFPVGFWLAAQGALLMYLLIIVIYVQVMDRMEKQYLEAEGESAAESTSTSTSTSTSARESEVQ